MYSPGNFGANSYARVGLESSVLSANPHELIALLFQGARRARIRRVSSGCRERPWRAARGEASDQEIEQDANTDRARSTGRRH